MYQEDKRVLYDVGERISSLLEGKIPEKIAASDYPDETEKRFVEIVNQLIQSFSEIHEFIVPLSQGMLHSFLPERSNVLSSPFKELHARLLHLTWQTERVAEGDYTQRVDFMGDFSTAFNSMVAKLAEREQDLRTANDRLETKVRERTAELTREVAERKKAEQSLITLNKELEETIEKLRASNRELQRLTHVAAHDLKTPLRGIATLADWLATDYAEKFDEQGARQVKLLVERVKRVYRIIDGILKYSSVGNTKHKKQRVDLNVLLAKVISEIDTPENIDIEVENELPVILCERTGITEVFKNLLSNAVIHMDKPHGKVKISSVEEAGFWKFRVTDNGPGIEEKYFGKIFEIFQALSASDETNAIGIGLSVVKKIIETYHGQIWVESKIGRGSTFVFTLPAQEVAIPN